MTATATRVIYDGFGQVLQLGVRVGRGGEGSVYELANYGARVAKIYHDPSRVPLEKLAAMVRLNNSDLAKISAWPERTLHLQRGSRVVGFVMPRANGEELAELIGPGSRKDVFPVATYPFVVRSAVNLARAFVTTHQVRAVIGDVKALNAKVDGRAIVTLIDTDGFQITDPVSGKIFHTAAVTAEYQPPELQGIADFSRLVRTPDQDAFGLAVLIFELLFMGRHPFLGTRIKGADLPPADMIKLRQFTFEPNLLNRLYAQPPASLPLSHVGPLGPMFSRAFIGPAGSRPTARDWVDQLERYERQLTKCALNSNHAYLGAGPCPLCELEGRTGTLLFLGTVVTAVRGSVFDLTTIWAQITAVPSPGPVPPVPAPPTAAPAAPAVAIGRIRRQQKLAAAGVVLIGAFITWAVYLLAGSAAWWTVVAAVSIAWVVYAQGTQDAGVYHQEFKRATSALDLLVAQWKTQTGDAAYREKLAVLERARDTLSQLEDERKQRLAELHRTIQQRQLEHYLQSHRIGHARISQIGPTRITTLRSFGVESAFDIHRGKLNQYIPQIGAARKARLYDWYRAVKGRFRFDPTRGIDPQDLAALELDINRRRAPQEQLLKLGPMALRQLTDQAKRRRQELFPEIARAQAAWAQARANSKAAG